VGVEASFSKGKFNLDAGLVTPIPTLPEVSITNLLLESTPSPSAITK